MDYLLIHGSWHGAWCWHKIVPRLEAEGHRVMAPDLPGRITNPALPVTVSLARMVADLARRLPKDRKTTVVVHSRYGVVASALSEACPERIERVIYLASFMLPTGKRAAGYFRWDRGSALGPHVSVNRLGMWDFLDPAIYREGLYHDCAEDDYQLARSLLVREPLRPALARLQLSAERYGQVPRAYIRLTQDRAVTPTLQDRVLNQTGAERVESIEASHSAYFARPDELTAKIIGLSRP